VVGESAHPHGAVGHRLRSGLGGALPDAVVIGVSPSSSRAAIGKRARTQSIVFRDLLVTNRSGRGLYIPYKAVLGALVLFERANFSNTAVAAPAVIQLGDGSTRVDEPADEYGDYTGDVTFTNVTVVDQWESCRPFL
jgi:hypothetical protein